MSAHALVRCPLNGWRVVITVADDRCVHVTDMLHLAANDRCHPGDDVVAVNERTRVVTSRVPLSDHQVTRALATVGMPIGTHVARVVRQ